MTEDHDDASTKNPSDRPRSPIDRATAAARSEALIGTTISGRYRIDELVAMGGMGAVYRGEHTHLHKRVAIKVLHPDAESLPELVVRFRREAVAGGHVHHPNVAAATDFGELEDGSYFLVLEYVQGMTLHEHMMHGPIDQDRATRIARQLALALEAVHAKGIVHRDVKPKNVMLAEGPTGQEVVKLIDFGLAKVDAEQLVQTPKQNPSWDRITGVGTIFGTIAYIAPECALGMDAVDHRADLYALGVVLYEMLAGKHLFDGSDPAEIFTHTRSTNAPLVSERNPDVHVHPAIEGVVGKLLEKNPDARIQTATEVVAALDGARIEAGLENGYAITASARPPRAEGGEKLPSLRAPSVPTIEVPAPLPPPALPPPALPPLRDAPAARDAVPDSSGAVSSRPPPPADRARAQRTQIVALSSVIVVLVVALVISIATRPKGPPPRASTSATAATTAQLAPPPVAPSVAASPASAPPSASAATPAPSTSADVGTTIDLDDIASDSPEADAALSGLDVPALARMLRRSVASKHWIRAEQALLALIDRDPDHGLDDDATRAAARDAAFSLDNLGDGHGDKLLDALEKRAGTNGLDVLFDIVQSRGRSRPATRAAMILRKPEVAKRATPALRIALELRDATCVKKLTLLERAQNDGDVRALTALETFAQPCFKKPNKALTIAIRRLKDKLGRP